VSSALAQVGGRAVTETELEKLLHDSGVRIVIRKLQDAPKLLQDWDLLEPTDGGFRFRVELLRRWIEENKPLKRVQDELDRIEPIAEGFFQAAQGYYNESDFEKAEPPLRQAISLNPNHVKANKLLADLLIANGKYAEAQALLASLYEYQPIEARSRLVQAWLGLASLAVDEQEKLGCYEAILNIDPNQTEAVKAYKTIWEAIGDRALEQERLTEALAAYKKAGRAKKIAHIEQKIHEAEAKQFLDELKCLEQEKNYSEAINLIKKLEIEFSQLLDWHNEQTRIEQLITLTTHYQQALDAIKLGHKKQARELLAKVITIDPEFEEAARYLLLAVNETDYKQLNQHIEKLICDNNIVTDANNFLQEKTESLTIDNNKLASSNSLLSEELNACKDEIDVCKKALNTMNANISEAHNALVDKNTKLKNLGILYSETKATLDNTLKQKEEILNERDGIKNSLVEKNDEIKSLTKDINNKNKGLDGLTKQNLKLIKENAALELYLQNANNISNQSTVLQEQLNTQYRLIADIRKYAEIKDNLNKKLKRDISTFFSLTLVFFIFMMSNIGLKNSFESISFLISIIYFPD
jgi:tetratricopeptide (TPR) repeat protein